MKKYLMEDDLKAKFERYTEFTENISDYNKQEESLALAKLKDSEEIKEIHDQLNIEFGKELA